MSKSGLKTYAFVRDIPKKVKKTLHGSATKSPSIDFYIEFAPFGIRQAQRFSAPSAPEVVSSTAAQTLRNHAPGARMTVVYFKETNSLKFDPWPRWDLGPVRLRSFRVVVVVGGLFLKTYKRKSLINQI